ncbi:MAG: 30S ribosomal protein S18 [Candidatus Levybacteria bacterium RIFOXYA1_FULL_41_10]|nr:MAG: 30S ribosomal protein S18 [Candidatus Levybacteria bacterium RIFCSPHIGHO2_02_FULL_40_29]OGH32283.1 MAG: 30S ribosomal protein S18 [Candidatus Levybacteria bacterium RIFCSPHIGHO2_12_FULL_40_44]OGH41147.1 MAG: 30S ribosomal protein S18 [Candidatus Levybacteria bacterium RIFCSPLOWO2_01_FULL_40_96]OGH49935.1 MAG: 30S ribosomal protein S18 [Candidatus Levybacteria bacterium RIFCSPLOWO2_02_FULL_40_18]OGH52069.1 MAG: 30S ribosomal protein S18 [Candidatus Levybacteria bacterium RIFCSPLOWO2_12_F
MPKSKKTHKPRRIKTAPKKCYFCEEKRTPSFKEVSYLQRFITERGKIISRSRTGLCSKHQNGLARNIKYARHLALLPFVAN